VRIPGRRRGRPPTRILAGSPLAAADSGQHGVPVTRAGKAWSDTACYRACKAVLAAAGMDPDAGGVFKLRHTFALRQLAKGKSEAEVARWLGLLDVSGMARYRRIVPGHVDLV
jgi:site-specific recombinase XerD